MSPWNEHPLSIQHEEAARNLLVLLLGPYQLAHRQGRHPLNYALDIKWLQEKGIGTEAIQLGASRGQIECDPEDAIGPDSAETMGRHAQIALTETGAFLAWKLMCLWSKERPSPPLPKDQVVPQRKPRFDRKKGLLFLDDVVILRLSRCSSFQWLVLDAFQNAHWAERVENPLRLTPGYRPERLFQTAKDLSRKQKPRRVHFAVELDGESVRWDVVDVITNSPQTPPELPPNSPRTPLADRLPGR
jgi:hypothetical protein